MQRRGAVNEAAHALKFTNIHPSGWKKEIPVPRFRGAGSASNGFALLSEKTKLSILGGKWQPNFSALGE